MPFGLKNAPARFQRYVNEVLKDLVINGNIVVYMDDFLIATDTLEKHLDAFKQVFSLLVQNLLELCLDKYRFLYEEVEFLGYVVSEREVRPSNHGIMAVRKFPIPKNIRDVRSFVGLCSYFRKFIENFFLVVGLLYELLNKETNFAFGQEQLSAFELLKSKLIEAPILSTYSPNDPTELHCDANLQGFGAVLMQRKADNRSHSIFYFSKQTTETESHYHSYELEMLAIIYALKKFCNYL